MEDGATQYLFSGTYEHSLDDKGRLTIPSSFRKDFADGVVLRKGSDGSVEILPQPAWNLFLQEMGKISKTDVRGQKWLTRQLAAAVAAELDKQGRVLVPGDMRSHVGVDMGKVVVTGALDRLKVWSSDRWAEIEAEEMEELDEYVYAKYQI